jgi:Protein of unknown function (DUF1329)
MTAQTVVKREYGAGDHRQNFARYRTKGRQNLNKLFYWAGCTLAAALSISAASEAADVSDLGKSLSPFGAIKAGNAEGTIPAWTGGIGKPPSGYQPGQHYVDPYAGDKPLFTITGDNVDKYADKLGAGAIAKLKAYPSFKIMVYPSHRSFSAPSYVYDAAMDNARSAHLAADGVSPVGNMAAIPFPLADNGVEAMLNHILRWRGTQLKSHTVTAAVTAEGSYVEQKIDLKLIYPCAMPGAATTLDNYFYAETVEPARTAGNIVLVHSYTDPAVEPRLAWTYDPGQRRVRRAPEVAYDTPTPAYDSLETSDDFDLFNGALDRFDWKLLGKKEIYVPYNDYALQDPKYQYADLIRQFTLNPDAERWELHRVYVVEGALKSSARHIYSKRVYYLDEDSWYILMGDLYDGHHELWRSASNFTINYYDVPITATVGEEFVDLQARRYVIGGLFGRDPVPTYSGSDLQIGDFTPDSLRSGGH